MLSTDREHPACRLSVDGYRTLNEVNDTFRRLLKAAALESNDPAGGPAGTETVLKAAKQVCESGWLGHFEACDERPKEAA